MRNAVIALIVLAGVPLLLLLSGKRVLVSETKVQPGETYIVEDYGNLGASRQASLVCRYFTGRSIQTAVFWYSPNGFLGRDSCPFIYTP
ncbi:MAG TPA: hypothetical protein VNA24_30470 [Hyalangium sp.]|jgi:hypothetical protein|nr:hypothetical protein [Hyalangium sp.]